MTKTSYLFVLFALCVGCHSKTKTLKFSQFTIEVPAGWQAVKAQGIDSYVGMIAIDKKDTVNFDLGWYSNKLFEEEQYLVDGDKVYIVKQKKKSPHDNDYTYYGQLDTIKRDLFITNCVSYMMIDGRKAKLIEPKIPGKGTTGIYIDSLWKAGSDNDRLQLSGRDLSATNEKQFLEALKTLKFHKD